jgi:A/G-specific adenine glycosylase
MITDKISHDIAERILAWYARHQRNLPWRKTRDPYHIWVSEVMLQQTQVETVIPYYQRFLSCFPTVQALASASLPKVLKVWENMGYYARARNLHRAAKEIVDRFQGAVPQTWDDLTALPGVGSYTAGAILSVAFDQPAAAVDANVRRVLSRLFAIQKPLHESRTERHLWDLAGKLIPMKGGGRFNQGLMDLGATVCTSKKPACGLCPIQECCQAYEGRLQDVLPVTRKRGPIPHRQVTAGVIWNDCGQVLIVRRPNQGLLGGLWKFPGGTQNPGESLPRCLRRHVREELGVQVRIRGAITSVNHAYTHFRITLHAFHCAHQTGEPQPLTCAGWRWTTLGRLKDFAFSKADRKIIHAVLSQNGACQASLVPIHET